MWSIFKGTVIVLACVAAASFFRSEASLRIHPLVVTLEQTAQGSSSVVQLTNITDSELPFEVTVVRRTVADGEEVEVPADDDFVIFPPQMILPPGESQALRIQWLGTSVSESSQSFYVYVRQVPAELEPGQSGMRISYRFGISVHVVPPGTKPDLHVLSIAPASNEDGEAGFDLTVLNQGNRFARMSEHELSLDGRETMSRLDIKEAIGTGFILPGQQRTFFVPYEGQLPSNVTAKVDYRGLN